jgi:phosphate transport system protein
MIEDPKNIGRATYLLWVAHNLERIGDRATNLCERTIFAATGQVRELNRPATAPGYPNRPVT